MTDDQDTNAHQTTANAPADQQTYSMYRNTQCLSVFDGGLSNLSCPMMVLYKALMSAEGGHQGFSRKKSGAKCDAQKYGYTQQTEPN